MQKLSTTDAVGHAVCLAEKHGEKNKSVRADFLDFEMALDRIPHKATLRIHNIA